MRILACVTMMLLAVVSVVEGSIALGLALAGAKALIVGFGYMELPRTALAHTIGFTASALMITGGLMIIL